MFKYFHPSFSIGSELIQKWGEKKRAKNKSPWEFFKKKKLRMGFLLLCAGGIKCHDG